MSHWTTAATPAELADYERMGAEIEDLKDRVRFLRLQRSRIMQRCVSRKHRNAVTSEKADR